MPMLDENRAAQLTFAVRHPDKPPGYDAQKIAEELVELLEAAIEDADEAWARLNYIEAVAQGVDEE